jgi:hypothetical protein
MTEDAAHLLDYVRQIGAKLPSVSFTGGCGRMADGHLHQLRSLCSNKLYGDPQLARLCTRRSWCSLYHHGNVHAIQGNNEDFLCPSPRRVEPDGALKGRPWTQ